MLQGIRRWGAVAVLLLSSLPFSAAAESSSVTAALAGLTGQARLNALVMLSNTGHLAGPYTPADVDQILAGMEGLRGQTLAMLTSNLKSNLSSTEVAILLNGLTGQDRVNALAWLSNAGRLSRPFTLSEIDAVTGIAAPSPATTANPPTWTTTANPPTWTTTANPPTWTTTANPPTWTTTANPPTWTTTANPPTWTTTANPPTWTSTSQQPPTSLPGWASIGQALVVSAPSGLDFGEVVLGSVSQQDIFFKSGSTAMASATCSISPPFSLPSGCALSVQPGITQRIPVRFSPTQPGRVAGTLTVTVTAPDRVTRAIPVSANAVAGASVPAASPGPALPGSTSATPAAFAAVNARIAHLRILVSQQQPYLYGSTSPWDDISIVARDLPVRLLGLTDYRALYDQLYFTTFQYTGLASKQLSRAALAAQRGDLASANALLDRVLTLLTQRNASYSGAVAMADHDLERARTYVKATYEASKWAAKAVAVGIPGASCMVDAAGSFTDFALNAQESGLATASKQFATDQIIDLIVDKLPIPGLDGRTLADAMENRAGKLLATAGVINDLKTSLSDPVARKVVIDAAKSLVAQPGEDLSEAAISAQLDRIVAADATNF